MFEREYADPYVIAEIGMNYEGSMDRAKRMISSVARAGGHAAKFQTYKAETIASAKNSPAYWDTNKESTTSQFELFQRFDAFGPDEYRELAEHCESEGIDFLSTPFDLHAVDFLAPLMPAVKIASADLTNVPLLRKVARTGKPVIMSVGASTLKEIEWALGVLEDAGANEIALLHCVLRYPTPEEQANLLGIATLQREFGDRVTVGYSDHVAPTDAGDSPSIEIAATLGARIIEKHFTDNRAGVGNDHYHAFDEDGLRSYTEYLGTLRTLAGDGSPDVDAQSAAIQNARRRIFVVDDIAEGQTIAADDLIALRADTGIEVAQWDQVVGRAAARMIAAGDPVTASDLR